MNLLGIDIGSSSVKCAILRHGKLSGTVARAAFNTRYDGVRAEVDSAALLKALGSALRALGPAVRKVDVIALAAMGPSWLAMDHEGRALTPIITHQDRRSIAIAQELEQRVGHDRHLEIAGNRPIPGGISSTTWAWFLKHEPAVMKKADLCGHLPTFLHRLLTHSRVTDPSHASFMGFYSTLDQSGWSDELMDAVGIKPHRLPQVIASDGVAGLITREAGRRFGLIHGTPMLAGMMDGSAGMLFAGARPGQLFNVAGSTDVLALCTDRPSAHRRLLTRALGTGDLWLSISTIAASGSAISWAHEQLFPDLGEPQFHKLVSRLIDGSQRKAAASASKTGSGAADGGSTVTFDPALAGDRTSIEQCYGSFMGLTLSTTREDMLRAVLESLARASGQRLALLKETNGLTFKKKVLTSGGVQQGLSSFLYRDWPKSFTFTSEEEATLLGLGTLAPEEL